MASTKKTREPAPSPARNKKPGYGSISFGLLMLMLSAAGLQTLLETERGVETTLVELLVIAAGVTTVVGVFLFASWRRIYRYLASADAAVVVLVALMLATVLGTVVLQEVDEATFRSRYPNFGTFWLALHVDDIFHSLPFALLLGLLALTSTITVVRRRMSFKKWRHMGLLISHISVLIILVGGLIGSLAGKRGMMHLLVGQAGDGYMTTVKGDKASERVDLGFQVRLDKFELDHYDPEFKFYTYEELPETDGWKVVSAEEPEVGASVGRARGDARTTVTVKKLYHSITRKSIGPDKHTVTLKDGRSVDVTVGQHIPLPDGGKATITDYFPDFVIDMESRQVYSRSADPNNPTLEVKLTDARGGESTVYLFGREELRKAGHGNAAGLMYALTPGPSELADDPDGKPNPAAEVEIGWPNGKKETALLLAASPKPIDLGDGRVLVYREKPEMIKNYRSTLTVVQNGRDVMTQEIKVNHPMYFGEFAFYQANFDPKNPSYSGIEVVKDPGLGLVTFGLWALIVGVFHTIALRNWKPWWERGARTVTPARGSEVEVAA